MSWVTSMIAVPFSRHRRLRREVICAWIETSSAVVGSSAMMSAGSAHSASAITTRWRIPPENWCGNWSMRVSAAGIPTCLSRSSARSRACARLSVRWVRMVSTIWSPTLSSGWSEVSGSWKIAPILRPRTLRIASGGSVSMRSPERWIDPPAIRPGGSSSPITAVPVSDLPAPDSPTTPRISPGAMSKETPSSAVSGPLRPSNTTLRSRIESSGC